MTGVCFADFGAVIRCVDKDEEKIKALGRGEKARDGPASRNNLTNDGCVIYL